jgi:hypothetical protein
MFERIKAFLWGIVMIVLGAGVLTWAGTQVVVAADIAQNGKVATAKVVSSRMEMRRSGRRSVRTVYVHTLQFDGKRATMDLIAPRPDGSQLKVIYLKSAPHDPRVFVSRDWGDVLGWTTFNWIMALVIPGIFIVAGAGWLFTAFRRRRRGRRAAVEVVVTASAAPDPYPPAVPAYPPAAPPYPGAPASPYGSPSGQYAAPPGQYPPAPAPYGQPSGQYAAAPGQYPPAPAPAAPYGQPSGQYAAQPGQYPPAPAPGQYPPAPAPGQWPPPGPGGAYPPSR